MTQIERIVAKGQLVPLLFSQDAVADSQSAVDMNVLETGATSGVLTVAQYNLPYDFDVVAVSIESSTARTAGTLTVEPEINGTATGLQAALDATNTLRHYARQDLVTDRGSAGDRVSVRLTTSSWTPVAADIVVLVWVVLYVERV